MKLRLPAVAAIVAFGVVASACSGGVGSDASSAGDPSASAITAEIGTAASDLAVHQPSRFLVGLGAAGGKVVSFGTVSLAFFYTGTKQSALATPQPGPTATGTYLPTPGTEPGTGHAPALTSPSQARGMYQAEGVTFDKAGFWQVRVTANIQGVGSRSATTEFAVRDAYALPAPGDKALHTDNLTLASKGVPVTAIDSAAVGGKVPDPDLHRWTIAGALDAHVPILVIFSTPAFCISQFCGPETQEVATLAKRYGNRAAFIHVEIWRDYQKTVINKAAADWIYRNNDVTEPWVYLINSKGVIEDRWGGLFDPNEVAADLAKLPRNPQAEHPPTS